MSHGSFGFGLGTAISLAVIGSVCGGLYGCPSYNVYSSEKEGQAEYARAEANRQIVVRQAQAKLDASKLEAGAEVERAKGVAEANKIIGSSLHDNEAYLRYLWITNIESSRDRTVVYVPTEAQLPILEAGRLPAIPRQGSTP